MREWANCRINSERTYRQNWFQTVLTVASEEKSHSRSSWTHSFPHTAVGNFGIGRKYYKPIIKYILYHWKRDASLYAKSKAFLYGGFRSASFEWLLSFLLFRTAFGPLQNGRDHHGGDPNTKNKRYPLLLIGSSDKKIYITSTKE